MKRAEIKRLIIAAVDEFGKSPRQINSGHCDEFADALRLKFKGFRIEVSDMDRDDFNHVWVSYRGWHYDAETPEGVRTRKEIGTKPAYRKGGHHHGAAGLLLLGGMPRRRMRDRGQAQVPRETLR